MGWMRESRGSSRVAIATTSSDVAFWSVWIASSMTAIASRIGICAVKPVVWLNQATCTVRPDLINTFVIAEFC